MIGKKVTGGNITGGNVNMPKRMSLTTLAIKAIKRPNLSFKNVDWL